MAASYDSAMTAWLAAGAGIITCGHPAMLYVLIRPRHAKALRSEVYGRMVYSTVVRNPGTRANNFLTRALRQGC